MKKTKIEWADSTWNPITGCRHGCPYCYAASIAKRFCGNVRENKSHFSEYGKKGSGLYVLEKPYHDETGAHRAFPFGFAPTFHKYRLGEPARLNGRTIFVGSMCDLFGDWVPKEWLNDVINSCLEGPQHNYLFLTKNPRMYEELGKLRHEPNFWFGTSVTCNADVEKAHALYCALCSPDKSFISFKPLREKISFDQEDSCTDTWNDFDWFIIGAETGNHSGKVVPDPEWIVEIVKVADKFGIPVFMKDSLIPIVGEDNMRRDFPKGLQVEKSTVKTRGTCMKCGTPSIKKHMVTLSGKMGRDGSAHTVGQMCRECLEEWLRDLGQDVPEEWRA